MNTRSIAGMRLAARICLLAVWSSVWCAAGQGCKADSEDGGRNGKVGSVDREPRNGAHPPDLAPPPPELAGRMRQSLQTRINHLEDAEWQQIDATLTMLEDPTSTAIELDRQEAFAKVVRQMMQTGVTSHVTFMTAVDGAVVRFQAYGDTEVGTANGTTQDASADLPIGYYFFWTERNNERTSEPLPKEILLESEGPIPLQEHADG